MTFDQQCVEAVAEALFIEASKDRFGKWPTVTEPVKAIWRKSAVAAITAIEAMHAKKVDR